MPHARKRADGTSEIPVPKPEAAGLLNPLAVAAPLIDMVTKTKTKTKIERELLETRQDLAIRQVRFDQMCAPAIGQGRGSLSERSLPERDGGVMGHRAKSSMAQPGNVWRSSARRLGQGRCKTTFPTLPIDPRALVHRI